MIKVQTIVKFLFFSSLFLAISVILSACVNSPSATPTVDLTSTETVVVSAEQAYDATPTVVVFEFPIKSGPTPTPTPTISTDGTKPGKIILFVIDQSASVDNCDEKELWTVSYPDFIYNLIFQTPLKGFENDKFRSLVIREIGFGGDPFPKKPAPTATPPKTPKGEKKNKAPEMQIKPISIQERWEPQAYYDLVKPITYTLETKIDLLSSESLPWVKRLQPEHINKENKSQTRREDWDVVLAGAYEYFINEDFDEAEDKHLIIITDGEIISKQESKVEEKLRNLYDIGVDTVVVNFCGPNNTEFWNLIKQIDGNSDDSIKIWNVRDENEKENFHHYIKKMLEPYLTGSSGNWLESNKPVTIPGSMRSATIDLVMLKNYEYLEETFSFSLDGSQYDFNKNPKLNIWTWSNKITPTYPCQEHQMDLTNKDNSNMIFYFIEHQPPEFKLDHLQVAIQGININKEKDLDNEYLGIVGNSDLNIKVEGKLSAKDFAKVDFENFAGCYQIYLPAIGISESKELGTSVSWDFEMPNDAIDSLDLTQMVMPEGLSESKVVQTLTVLEIPIRYYPNISVEETWKCYSDDCSEMAIKTSDSITLTVKTDYKGKFQAVPVVTYHYDPKIADKNYGKNDNCYKNYIDMPSKSSNSNKVFIFEKQNESGNPNLLHQFLGCGYLEISWQDQAAWPKYHCVLPINTKSGSSNVLNCDYIRP